MIMNDEGILLPEGSSAIERLARTVATVLVLLAMAVVFFAPEAAHAGNRLSKCGGKDQRPCNLWEAIPSCDASLVEDFIKGQCLAKDSGGNPPPPPPESRPADCGREGQRPCNLWEAIPSCESGLAENFLDHQCVLPGDGTQLGDLVEDTGQAIEELVSSIHLDPPNCQEIFADNGVLEINTTALYNYKLFVELPAEIAYEAVPKDTLATSVRVAAAVGLYAVRYCGLTLERDVALLNGDL